DSGISVANWPRPSEDGTVESFAACRRAASFESSALLRTKGKSLLRPRHSELHGSSRATFPGLVSASTPVSSSKEKLGRRYCPATYEQNRSGWETGRCDWRGSGHREGY